MSTSSYTSATFKTMSCAIRHSVKPPQRNILYCLKQITLIATKTKTNINGMPVCTKHYFSSAETSVSIHSLNVRIDDMIIRVKKKRWRSNPKESRCHTMIPSFLWNMSRTNT